MERNWRKESYDGGQCISQNVQGQAHDPKSIEHRKSGRINVQKNIDTNDKWRKWIHGCQEETPFNLRWRLESKRELDSAWGGWTRTALPRIHNPTGSNSNFM